MFLAEKHSRDLLHATSDYAKIYGELIGIYKLEMCTLHIHIFSRIVDFLLKIHSLRNRSTLHDVRGLHAEGGKGGCLGFEAGIDKILESVDWNDLCIDDFY